MANVPALKELETGGEIAPIVPRTVNEVGQVVDQIVQAGMVPAGLAGRTEKETRAKLGIAIMKGLEVGFAPLTAVANIMVVNNRASIWGDALPALAQRSGDFKGMKERYEGEPGKDDRTAICELYRRGVDEPCVRRFSLADAKRAKLFPNKGPWMMYPDRMLQMRARGWAFRDLFADSLMGLSVAEEAQDLPMRDVTPNASALLDDEDPSPPVTDVTDEPESEVMPDTRQEPVGTHDAEPPSFEAGASDLLDDDGRSPALVAIENALAACKTADEIKACWKRNQEALKTMDEAEVERAKETARLYTDALRKAPDAAT